MNAALDNLPGPAGAGKTVVDDIRSFDSVGDVPGLVIDANSFVQSGVGLAMGVADPVNYLISQGLGFLLNVVVPLQKAVRMVTGDGEALAAAAGEFGSIGQGVGALGRTVDSTVRTELSGWSGPARDAAMESMGRFLDGVGTTAQAAGGIAMVLKVSSMIMTVAEEIVKGILADLIEWLVVTWLAALAASVFTFGGSTAAASSATVVKSAENGRKAAGIIGKLRTLLAKIREVLRQIRNSMSSAGRTFIEENAYRSAATQAHGYTVKAGALTREKGFEKALKDSVENNVFKKPFGLDESRGVRDHDNEYVDPLKVAAKLIEYDQDQQELNEYSRIGKDDPAEDR